MIDLAEDEATAAQAVRRACVDFGFFKICNHGLSEELVDRVMALNHAFFDLPVEAKMKIHADENFRCVLKYSSGVVSASEEAELFVQPGSCTCCRGYTPHKEETLDAKAATQGDSKEGLYFGREVSLHDPESSLPLTGPNQWPSEVRQPPQNT